MNFDFYPQAVDLPAVRKSQNAQKKTSMRCGQTVILMARFAAIHKLYLDFYALFLVNGFLGLFGLSCYISHHHALVNMTNKQRALIFFV